MSTEEKVEKIMNLLDTKKLDIMAVEPSRWGIIYNPKAGSRKTQKRWNEIRDYMESRKVVFDYVQSEGFGSVGAVGADVGQ